LVLFAGVLVAVSFASCGGNKAEAPVAEEAEVIEEVAAEVVDSAACCGDSVCVCDSAAADSVAAL
jgi:hypothetical protein